MYDDYDPSADNYPAHDPRLQSLPSDEYDDEPF